MLNKKVTPLALFFMVSSAFAASSQHVASKSTEATGSTAKPQVARAELMNAQGEKVGTVTFEESKSSSGVKLTVIASKLSPGKHGIHFHENGKCEGPDFKSAGSHLGGAGKEHGLENSKGPHAGDLPNLEVGKDGTVKADLTSDRVTLASGHPNSLLKTGGSAVVIHEKADDQKSSPAGDSGARIACGVIR